MMVNVRGIIPFYGRTIQVSEMLYFTQSYAMYTPFIIGLPIKDGGYVSLPGGNHG